MAVYIPYAAIDLAARRSAELWLAHLGREVREGDVTRYLYGRRERTGEPEADADLPDGVDAAIVVHERTADLDGLVLLEQLTAEEIAALLALYPAWAAGVDYAVGDFATYEGSLYRCIQAHPSISTWHPDIVPALWTRCAPANVIAPWVQPVGASDCYNLGDHVTHAGYIWESLIAANVWEPGSVGAEALWQQIGTV